MGCQKAMRQGETLVVGLSQSGFRLLALRDIGHESHRKGFLINQDGTKAEFDWKVPPALVEARQIQTNIRGTYLGFPEELDVFLPVLPPRIRRDQLQDRFSDEVRLAISKHAGCPQVCQHDFARSIDGKYSLRRRLHQGSDRKFAFAQVVIGPLPLGNIPG